MTVHLLFCYHLHTLFVDVYICQLQFCMYALTRSVYDVSANKSISMNKKKPCKKTQFYSSTYTKFTTIDKANK